MSPEDSGVEAFNMEIALGASTGHALRRAIAAAVETAHRAFIVATRDDIMEKAEDIDLDEGNYLIDDGPASLIWYAILLDETLPPEYRKEEL